MSEKKSAHSDYIRSVAFSPDGKTIVSGSNDKTIKVWDAGAYSAQNRLCIAFARLLLTLAALPHSHA